MDRNEISLRIIGKNGDESLSPANFDIRQIRFIHLNTKDVGSLTIRADKESLAGYQGIPLHSPPHYTFFGKLDFEG